MQRQLFRSKGNRMIAGVCGGIAEYFGVDATIVRLIWVLVTLTYGLGLIAYIIAVIVIPERGYESFDYNQEQYSGETQSGDSGFNKPVVVDKKMNIVIGGILVLLGLFAIARRYLHWLDFNLVWPVILIIMGALIVYNGWRKRI